MNNRYIYCTVDLPVFNIKNGDVFKYDEIKQKYPFVDFNNEEYFKTYEVESNKFDYVKIDPMIKNIWVGQGTNCEFKYCRMITGSRVKEFINERFYKYQGFVYSAQHNAIMYHFVGSDTNKDIYVKDIKHIIPYNVKFVIDKNGNIWETSKEKFGRFNKELGNEYESRQEANVALAYIERINIALNNDGYGNILSSSGLKWICDKLGIL